MAEIKSEETSEKKSLNFIEQIVENDLKEGKNDGKVQTRFPPEPNGYLHIGHAKAICLDFGIAAAHGGICNLRFDDTNPTKEDVEYVEAIKEDIQWLGYQWGNEYYASDYFQQLWDFAIRLIKEGKAYIDEQTSEQIAAQKGTPPQPGVESPYRNRPIEETLDLFQKMNSGEIEEGAMVLRAKIDMASPNMHFRDPIIYRVVKHPHHRTGTTWKAYPMYDFAHGQSDFFEGVTHSLCTLEFVPHRPLYDLFIDWLKEGKDLNDNRPRQPVRDVRLDYSKRWQHQHWGALVASYRSSPYFDFYAGRFEPFYRREWEFLADYNLGLLEVLCSLAGVPMPELSRTYVEAAPGDLDLRPKRKEGLALIAEPYFQVFSERMPFVPNLSFADLLFAEGPEAVSVLARCRQE